MTITDTQGVLTALTEKRAELGTRRVDLTKQLADLDQKLMALNGAISIFMPPSTSATDQQEDQSRYSFHDLRRGEIGWSALDILRQSNTPMTSKQITEEFCRQRRYMLDKIDLQRLSALVLKALRHKQSLDLVRDVGRTPQNAILWMSEHVWS